MKEKNKNLAWTCLQTNCCTKQNKPISHGSVNLMRKLNYHTQREQNELAAAAAAPTTITTSTIEHSMVFE